MAAFRQHVAFAAGCGVAYGVALHELAGVHWLYGGTAALLATVGGLLPDLDAPNATPMRGFTTLVGVLAAIAVAEDLHQRQPGLPVEVHLWAVLGTFILARGIVRHGFARLMVHRGMLHSVPAALIWGELAYLVYPSRLHAVRLVMAVAVVGGVLSHLVLDEIFSVDIAGARLKRSRGTALKFWSGSLLATIATYALLFALTWLLRNHSPVRVGPWRSPPAPIFVLGEWLPRWWP